MRRSWAALLVMTCLFLATRGAEAGERELTAAQLRSVGVPGLRVMTDVEGQRVRGQGVSSLGTAWRSLIIRIGSGQYLGGRQSNTVMAAGFSFATR